MEFIVVVVGQAVLLLLNLTFGLGLAAVTYWLWLATRRRLWGLDKVVSATTPDGESYSLEVPGLRMRAPLSRRIFNSNAARGLSPPEPNKADRLHPDRLAKLLDDLLVLAMPFLLLAVLLLVIVFVLELILAAIVVGVASIVATIGRHRWACVVSSPTGEDFTLHARGIRRVRRLRDETVHTIRSGDVSSLEEDSNVGQPSRLANGTDVVDTGE